MRIKPKPIQIDSAEIFKEDKLGREKEIENLNELIKTIETPFVLSLNSPWGSGKTTFTRLWVEYLVKNEKKALYFNAWETDFSEDPLLSFLGEIDEDFSVLFGHRKESLEAWEKTKVIGGKIARRSVPALVKVLTAGLLNMEDLIEGEISDVISGLSEDSIDSYLSQKLSIKEFKNNISIAFERSEDTDPIVIFVDELDRCRPSYAILLLERIKHLFDIAGVVFILSTDLEQLAHSIQAVYGNNFDAKGYLKRFIDLDYTLAEPNKKDYIESLFQSYRMESFFENRRTQPLLQYEVDHLIDTFETLSKWTKMSLREIEQVFGRVHIVLRATPQNSYLFPALVVFLVIMKSKRPDIYLKYTNDSDEPELAMEYLHSLAPAHERTDSFNAAVVEGFLIAAKHRHLDGNEDVLRKYVELVRSDEGTSEEKKYARTVVDSAMKPTGSNSGEIILASIISRINMFEKIEFLNPAIHSET